MKIMIYLTLFLVCGYSCSKSTTPSYIGKWKLVKTNWFVGLGSGQIYPGVDSIRTLDLNTNGNYVYSLNSDIESSGVFNIKKAGSYDQIQLIQSVPVKMELFPEVISFVKDTLLITSPPYPGGYSDYFYIRE